VNELIAICNSRALTFYGLNDAFDEELKEWDTFNLEEIPTIAVSRGFYQYNRFRKQTTEIQNFLRHGTSSLS
jgi:hypothetical protein